MLVVAFSPPEQVGAILVDVVAERRREVELGDAEATTRSGAQKRPQVVRVSAEVDGVDAKAKCAQSGSYARQSPQVRGQGEVVRRRVFAGRRSGRGVLGNARRSRVRGQVDDGPSVGRTQQQAEAFAGARGAVLGFGRQEAEHADEDLVRQVRDVHGSIWKRRGEDGGRRRVWE